MTMIDINDTRPSIVAMDVKEELGPMLAPAMREVGMKCLHINPTGRFSKIVPNSNVNFWHHYHDAFWSENLSHQRSVVPMVGNAVDSLIPEPPRLDTEAAMFFLDGYKSIPQIHILSDIVDRWIPYPSGLWEMISDPKAFEDTIKGVAARPKRGKTVRNKIEGYAIAKARTLLSKAQTKGLERYFEEFRAGAERHTTLYNNASHLANYGAKDSIPLSVLRQEPCFMTIATPLAFKDAYEGFHEQFVRAIFEMAKLTPGRTIYIMAEEAGASLPKGIERELTTMRGLNIKMDMIFQYPDQFALKAGEDGLKTLDSQIDVEIIGSISRSDDDTQGKVSKRFGQTTEAVTSQGTSQRAGAGSVNIDRRVREVLTPAQIAEIPRNKQFVFVSNAKGKDVKQPKTILEKVNYGQILPHRDLVSFNPIENKDPLFSDDIAIRLKYERGKAPEFVDLPDADDVGQSNAHTVEDEPFLTPFSFLWVPILLIIIAGMEIFAPISLLPF